MPSDRIVLRSKRARAASRSCGVPNSLSIQPMPKRRVVVLKMVREVGARDALAEPALGHAQVRQGVAVFVEGEGADRAYEDCDNRQQNRPTRPDERPEHDEVKPDRNQSEFHRIPIVATCEELWLIGEFVVADVATVQLVKHRLLGRRCAVVKKAVHDVFDDELHHGAVDHGKDQDRREPCYERRHTDQPKRQKPLQTAHRHQDAYRWDHDISPWLP